MDIVSLIIGFVIGVVVVALAIEIGMKKTSVTPPASRHTKKWSIGEIANPRIIAEYLGDVELPKNAKVLVNKYKDKTMFAGMDVKEHKGIKGNYILGDDRALVLSGPVKKDEIGVWTVEKEIVEQLHADFDKFWAEGTAMKKDAK
ncbi:MAG: hypothetical protein JW771_03660 [Candidatus Thermoplasmatota archaeon]|nr:hypothetical protein [Candidatus Thermoplasmatota archaeon]